MPQCYLFFRCWPEFQAPFPFDLFDGVLDDELPAKLNEWAEEKQLAEKENIANRLKEEEQAYLEWRQSSLVIHQISNGINQPSRFNWIYRGLTENDPLICRIGSLLGFWSQSDRYWSRNCFDDDFWGPIVWFAETNDEELAEETTAVLKDRSGIKEAGKGGWNYDDGELGKLLRVVNPVYGYVSEKKIPSDKLKAIWWAITELEDGKPAVPYPDLALLFGAPAVKIFRGMENLDIKPSKPNIADQRHEFENQFRKENPGLTDKEHMKPLVKAYKQAHPDDQGADATAFRNARRRAKARSK